MTGKRKRPAKGGRAKLVRGGTWRPSGTPLSRIPIEPVSWEGAVLDVAELVDLPPGAGPDQRVVLWVEVETGDVVAAEFVAADELPGALSELLITAIRRPETGKPRRPEVVAIRDPALEAPLTAVARPLGIDVVVDPDLDALDDAVAALGTYLAPRVPGRTYLMESGVTPPAVGRMFRAAAKYYAAAPWHVLDDDQPLELEVPGLAEPAYAVVLGGSGETYGLALHFSGDELDALYSGRAGHPPPPQDVLALSFDPEDTVPPEMRQERRLHRWPLAGPVAFPVAYRMTSDGELRGPNAAELELLAGLLDAVARIFEERRDAVSRERTLREELPWPPRDGRSEAGAGGLEAGVLRVSFPSRFGRLPGVERGGGAGRDPDPPAFSPEDVRRREILTDVDRRVSDLPHARQTVMRLAWTMFRSSEPNYGHMIEGMSDEDLELTRHVFTSRFIEWAVFAVRLGPGARTLAEQALDRAATELGPEALEERRRLIDVRWSIFEVVEAKPTGEVTVLDAVHGDTLRFEVPGDRPERGWYLTGALFPIDGDRYMPGTLVPVHAGAADLLPSELPTDPLELAPVLEEALFSAGDDWIHELDSRRAVRELYDEYREALGVRLPRFGKLERRIGNATSPITVLGELASGVEWWSEAEFHVLGRIVQRIWNLTPRRELGGRAPDDVV